MQKIEEMMVEEILGCVDGPGVDAGVFSLATVEIRGGDDCA